MRAFLFICVLFFVCLFTYVIAKPQLQDEPKCYLTNEKYTDCGPACEKTCDTALEKKASFYCPAVCVPGCFCKQGYLRNRWGNCIPKENCPCQGVDEVYTCGSACQTTCETLNQDCPIKTYKCVDGCQCRDGYARDNSGVCIPIPTCPGYNKF